LTQTLPILLDPQPEAEASVGAGRGSDFVLFAAQLMGQDGQRRGLRAGPQAIEDAQDAYREREYSGPFDRRVKAGVLTVTEA
jgi:hypothetical protein